MGRDHLVAGAGDVADHAAQARRRPGHAEHARAGIGHGAGADADHAAGVLVRVLLGPGHQRRDVVGLEGLDRRSG